MEQVDRADGQPYIVCKYLASIAQFGSREAALASLRLFALAPSVLEESNDGYILTYYMWPPSREKVVLAWPETTTCGIRRSMTGESYTPYDMVRGATMREWVLNGIMRRPSWKARNFRPTEMKAIVWNSGLSPAGIQSVLRWMPLGAKGQWKPYCLPYPHSIMWPWDMRDVYVAAVDDPATKRMYANNSTYLDIDEYCSRQTFLSKEMRLTILYTQKRPWVLGRVKIAGTRYMQIDEEKLRAEQEGGNPLRPQR